MQKRKNFFFLLRASHREENLAIFFLSRLDNMPSKRKDFGAGEYSPELN